MQFVQWQVNLNNFNYILLFYIQNELSSLVRGIYWITSLHQIKSPSEPASLRDLASLQSCLPLTLIAILSHVQPLQSNECNWVPCLGTRTWLAFTWMSFLPCLWVRLTVPLDETRITSPQRLPQLYLQHPPPLWLYCSLCLSHCYNGKRQSLLQFIHLWVSNYWNWMKRHANRIHCFLKSLLPKYL